MQLKIAYNFSYDYLVLLECAAGFFLNNGMCERCPANSIKADPGNETSCSLCDEASEAPNTQQTACGKLFSFLAMKAIILGV